MARRRLCNHKSTDQEVKNKTKVRIYLCKIYFVFISFVWGVFGKGGFCPGGSYPGVYVRGVLSGGFCPDTDKHILPHVFKKGVFRL